MYSFIYLHKIESVFMFQFLLQGKYCYFKNTLGHRTINHMK